MQIRNIKIIESCYCLVISFFIYVFFLFNSVQLKACEFDISKRYFIYNTGEYEIYLPYNKTIKLLNREKFKIKKSRYRNTELEYIDIFQEELSLLNDCKQYIRSSDFSIKVNYNGVLYNILICLLNQKKAYIHLIEDNKFERKIKIKKTCYLKTCYKEYLLKNNVLILRHVISIGL